jgi:hypothetical protein
MTLFGQKRDPNAPRKPLKRSGLRRKPAKARTPLKTGRSRLDADEAFMAPFRGLPDIMNGRTESKFLTDENGVKLKTEPHHILPKSIYPEYRHTPENIAVLTRENHSWAEDNPNLFDRWLKLHRPEIYEWKLLHQHHRKGSQ